MGQTSWIRLLPAAFVSNIRHGWHSEALLDILSTNSPSPALSGINWAKAWPLSIRQAEGMASNYAIQHDKSIFSTADNELSRLSSRSDLPSSISPPLVGERPSTQRKAHIHIQHPQLRDLIHPTEQRGVVYTVQANAVVRYDLRRPNQVSGFLHRSSS